MAHFEQRKTGWRVQVRRRGMPSISRTFDLKADAEAWAREIEREAQRGNVAALRQDAQRTTVAQVVERYTVSELPRHRSNSAGQYVRGVSERFGSYFLSNVRSIDVAAWRDDLVRSGLAASTVTHYINALSSIFRFAERGLSIPLPSGNPAQSVARPRPAPARERRLVGAEFDYLLRAADAKRTRYSVGLRQVLIFAVETSARASEILSLRWADVDLVRRVARIRGIGGGLTKNKDPFRTVALSGAAIDALQSLPRRIDGKVFTWKTPASMETVWTSCKDRARKLYAADCAAQGIKPDPAFLADLRFHDLRHEAASRLFEKGLGVMEVASMTGHKSLSMLKRYTHIEAEKLAKKLG